MNWKYFCKDDLNKESVGVLNALNINEAYIIASKIKNLPLQEFKKIFTIEKKKNG